ncbi:MAG: hypothetical protein WC368_01890 [Candidatus Cloacimonadaceae bacterium]
MRTGKTVDIHCRCGFLLFRYFKAGKGRLIKLIISRLSEDNVGLQNVQTFSRPLCPNCASELGIVRIIHGEPALKLNQGSIQYIRI